MWKGAFRELSRLGWRLLIVAAFVAGTGLTVGDVILGWRGGLFAPYKCHIRTEKYAVLAAREAITQFMIEKGRCPTSEGELFVGHYLGTYARRDRFGTPLFFHCDLRDGEEAEWVVSAGPDREFWTADDISSLDL